LRDGGAGYTLPWPGDACWLRSDLPLLQPRVLRLLWAHGDSKHQVIESLVGWAGSEGTGIAASFSQL